MHLYHGTHHEDLPMHPGLSLTPDFGAAREYAKVPWSSDIDPLAKRAFELIGLRLARSQDRRDGYSVGRQPGAGELREASLGARWR